MRGDGLDEGRGVVQLLGDVVGEVDVEPRVGAALLEAEAGLVELDTDLDRLAATGVAAPPPALDPPGVPLPQAARPMAASAATVAALIRPSFILVFPPCCCPGSVTQHGAGKMGLRSVREDLAEEVLGPVRLRVVEELLRRGGLDDLAVVHEDDTVARRAKPISWVTTIMVMPDLASWIMTSRTSLIISGSSAEVGSSKSMTLGSMASDRAIATRCCWPPESWAGYLAAWCDADPPSSSWHAAPRPTSSACGPSWGPA